MPNKDNDHNSARDQNGVKAKELRARLTKVQGTTEEAEVCECNSLDIPPFISTEKKGIPAFW